MDHSVCASELEPALQTVESNFAVVMGDASRVREALRVLHTELAAGGPEVVQECCRRLAPLPAERKGELPRLVFDFLEKQIPRIRDPGEIAEAMLQAREPDLARRTLELLLSRSSSPGWVPSNTLLLAIARLVDKEESPISDKRSLFIAGELLRKAPAPASVFGDTNPVESLFLAGIPAPLRRLAARILDRTDVPVPAARALRLLGSDAGNFLLPYLEYTRATHCDLVDLTPDPSLAPPALPSLREAERLLGRSLLSAAIARLGWPRLAWGLSVERLVGLRFESSFPFFLRPPEASMLEAAAPSQRIREYFLVTARGGAGEGIAEGSSADAVLRFRRYNVAHAEVLTELLEMAPLTPDRARKLIDHMDCIVQDFVELFRGETEEASRLPAVYAELRRRVMEHLQGRGESDCLSAEATRLVQMFEDPRCLDEVHTLHGLKRYLHQSGLRMAFRLFRAGSATNRTIDLVLASPRGIHAVVQQIRYLDFEPRDECGFSSLPLVVRLAAEGFARQMLYGRQSFPKLELLVYGNEVQVYAGFRNHPAFIRMDFSPPVRGGMIDLEYFAVSQYEMDQHPDLSLQAIQQLFRCLEFMVRKDGFRLQARYDREQAFDFGDITEKAAMLFCLVPYLMDLDWMIGSLEYPESSRPLVAKAWSEFFVAWGVPPADVVTASGCRVLKGRIRTPAGDREVTWDGKEPYGDIYAGTPPADLLDRMENALQGAGLGPFRRKLPLSGGRPSQLSLEQGILQPLRAAVLRGEIREAPDRLYPSPPGLFTRDHEAERFARVLGEGGPALLEAARMARVVASVERQLQFRTTGSVQGHAVQRAALHLRGETVGLFVLRHANGEPALAIASRDEMLCRSRQHESDAWSFPGMLNVQDLAVLLRRDNYLGAGDFLAVASGDDADRLRELFRQAIPETVPPALPAQVIPGIAAAPGIATGQVRFGEAGRKPESFDGCIYAAAVIRPEDAPYILRAAAVLTTGGGTLSHAGLVALELQKPALIVPGRWQYESGKPVAFSCSAMECEEKQTVVSGYSVVCREELAVRELRVREGDVVEVDADGSTMTALGQDEEILGLHRGLLRLASAVAGIAEASGDRELLEMRGQKLHSVHHLERIFLRTRNRVLAWHAVRRLVSAAHGAQTADIGGRSRLLKILLENSECNTVALETARRQALSAANQYESIRRSTLETIPRLGNLFELLFLRLRVLQLHSLLRETSMLFQAGGLAPLPPPIEPNLDRPIAKRLEELGQSAEQTRRSSGAACREGAEDCRVLRFSDGGRELARFMGGKAANLAEIGRVVGAGHVPPWFALADRAFREALAVRRDPRGTTLAEEIDGILRQATDAARKATAIRQLWINTPLPAGLESEILREYGNLGGSSAVAVRSSAFEEDTAQTAFPGQFDTFLNVTGERAVIDSVKLAWAGFWNERAIHLRNLRKDAGPPAGGGLIVQRMVAARLSGVVHTVCLATGNLTEMAINVGLGLGEGVVSGVVDVDYVHVQKPPGQDLKFHYRVGDKREQFIPDTITGRGTRRVESPYHQRFRPALEYTELCELAALTFRLETAYGEPLDIEFAWEGQSLYILQARSISVFHAALRETLAHYPLDQEADHDSKTGCPGVPFLETCGKD